MFIRLAAENDLALANDAAPDLDESDESGFLDGGVGLIGAVGHEAAVDFRILDLGIKFLYSRREEIQIIHRVIMCTFGHLPLRKKTPKFHANCKHMMGSNHKS